MLTCRYSPKIVSFVDTLGKLYLFSRFAKALLMTLDITPQTHTRNKNAVKVFEKYKSWKKRRSNGERSQMETEK